MDSKSKSKDLYLETVEEYIERTHSKSPTERKRALKEMCPCHVQKNFEIIWARVLEMTNDPDPIVRYQVVHTLCDGSPKEREDDMVTALTKMWNDPDEKIRRAVRRALGEYRRTGNWNVL